MLNILTGCDGPELDASRFRYRNRFNAAPGDASCKLCHLDVEPLSHFLTSCSALPPRTEGHSHFCSSLVCELI